MTIRKKLLCVMLPMSIIPMLLVVFLGLNISIKTIKSHLLESQAEASALLSHQEVFAPVRELVFLSTFILIAMLLVCTLISLKISKSLAQPIERLKDSVQKFGEGQFEHRAQEQGSTELQELSRSLNRMADKRKETSEELKRSNGELQEFAYIVSHDLKQPLRNITGYMEIIEEGIRDKLQEHNLRIYWDMVLESSERMKHMIADMLEYSKLTQSAQRLKHVDCQAILEHVLQDLSKLIKDEQCHIDYKQLPTVLGQEALLYRVFLNLIGNAIKFRKQDQSCQIEICVLDQDPSHYRFAIKDNGIGIAQKHQESIFHLFRRLHSENEYEGSGIGLAQCKKIVEFHQGEFFVESQEGQGSTFSFTLLKA